MALAIKQVQDEGGRVANAAKYHAQYQFLGRLSVPLVELRALHGVRLVTDNAGRQAISDEEWDKNQLFQLTWCSDRNNMLSYSGLPAPKASSGMTGGNYSAPGSMEKGGFRETLLPAVNLGIITLTNGMPIGGCLARAALEFEG